MIYYFSGTGNSKWTALKLGNAIEEECMDINGAAPAECMEEKVTGIVFPVYAWSPPEIVMDFAEKLRTAAEFTFAVATCGSEAGKSLDVLNSVFRLDSAYSIVMPNNYIIGSEPDTVEEALPKLEKADEELCRISEEINCRKKIWRVHEGKAAGLKSRFASYGFNRFARKTGSFYADESCTGCGFCADVCPLGTISICEGKPVWDKNCCQCTACINRCPEEAIQYGESTKGRTRYYIEKVTEKL